ncbi:MAG: 3-phosphoshikimate 1-carboxyvinyltransferase [Gemmatimonadales bacterium]
MIVQGTVTVPGDKSITHRLLLLAALARGTSEIRNPLTSLDARSSGAVLRRLGAEVSPLRSGRSVRVRGSGRFQSPDRHLDCGNSGTTARLLLGALAAHPFTATVTGDRSLRRRPMRRITMPLQRMGATVKDEGTDGLPVTITGGSLRALRYEMPVSSAQLKGSLLLAGLVGEVSVAVREPVGRSRDHTERLLRSFGYSVTDDGGWIRFEPTGRLETFSVVVPGDVSSAAFPVGIALLSQRGQLRIAAVGLNPTRTHYLEVLRRMGAVVGIEEGTAQAGEPVGDLIVGPATLNGVEVVAEEIPSLIDEIPMLAVLASLAQGTTVFREAGELRVKESDRLGLLASNIRDLGGVAGVSGNDLVIEGADYRPIGTVRTHGDHRLAMAFAVLGTLPDARVLVDDMECADVSFPGFRPMLGTLGWRAS